MRKIAFLVVLLMAFTAVTGAFGDTWVISDPETAEQRVIAQKILGQHRTEKKDNQTATKVI